MKARCLIREDFSSLAIARCFLPPYTPFSLCPSPSFFPTLSLSSALTATLSTVGSAGESPPALRSQLASNLDVEGGLHWRQILAAAASAIFFLSVQCRWPRREKGKKKEEKKSAGVERQSRREESSSSADGLSGGGSEESRLKENRLERTRLLREFSEGSGGIGPREALE